MAEYVTLKKPDGTIIYPQTSYESIMEFARPYDTGETVTMDGNTVMAGYISSSTTIIYCCLVLPKTMSTSITAATISAGGDFTARGISGYLLSSAVIGTSCTVSGVFINSTTRNTLRIAIKKTDGTAFSTTNNTPVSVVGNFTVTFS